MIEQEQHIQQETLRYNNARVAFKAHGILSIIFGGFGVLVGALFTSIFAIATSGDIGSGVSSDDAISFTMLVITTIIFWVIPHIYLIVAGFLLIRRPAPKLAQGLIIANLVVGVLCNIVLLVFAILNLTQLAAYERGYKTPTIQ